MFFVLWFAFIFMLFFFPVYILTKQAKKNNDLQQKKKEKEIELLQAQIDSLKEKKGT